MEGTRIDSGLAADRIDRGTAAGPGVPRSRRRLVLLPVLATVALVGWLEQLPAAVLVPALIALLAAVDFLLGLVAKS